jgi:hypothetical protein
MEQKESMMDQSKHTSLNLQDLNAVAVEEASVYGPDESHIGDISHIHGTGQNAQVVVDVGGFLGIGARPVALKVSQLNFMRDENGKVHAATSFDQGRVEEAA